ncbi:PatB family C-S lyase [Thiomicrorhabdus heinhorstiae]|uniref:cysteine-S-conjugate beta-lyase n=1 Tax=Thiomicrorhabdus heinhorstiae TaxID=2748010 RepID=A0ABS0BUB2_9GAMM|nr:PatB family C-S lyase [Thiomicrorhabdus heinhorstiae]MBF6057427.1 PatB family C-S lyase [Thiomicrorhabdus heinhorstiae]
MDLDQLDQQFDRAAFEAEKYALREALFGTEDVLPMWVADMDLPTPPFVIEAIQQRLQHPILGYTHTSDHVYQSIADWQVQYGYEVHRKQIVFTHNVANGFFLAVQAYTQPGDAVLVQPPVYPPFLKAPELNNRRVIEAPLMLQNNRYQIDFDAFEKAIVEQQVKLFLFCHPQNPSGRAWQKDELQKLAAICLKHRVIVVSDEIHADMTFPPNVHCPMASLSPEIAQNTVTLSSPGKTFNLGGLQMGYAIIANPQLKKAYVKTANSVSIHDWNLFAQIAVQAAYSEEGKLWRDNLLVHFQRNFDALESFLAVHMPKVKMMRPEASYLVWLDFREQFGTHAELKKWLIEEAKLGLNDGESFGGQSQSGSGFMRINLAVPTTIMQQAISQLRNALSVI